MKIVIEKNLNSLQARRSSLQHWVITWNDTKNSCNFYSEWKYDPKERRWYVSDLKVETFEGNLSGILDPNDAMVFFADKKATSVPDLEYLRQAERLNSALDDFWEVDYDIIIKAVLPSPDKLHVKDIDKGISLPNLRS